VPLGAACGVVAVISSSSQHDSPPPARSWNDFRAGGFLPLPSSGNVGAPLGLGNPSRRVVWCHASFVLVWPVVFVLRRASAGPAGSLLYADSAVSPPRSFFAVSQVHDWNHRIAQSRAIPVGVGDLALWLLPAALSSHLLQGGVDALQADSLHAAGGVAEILVVALSCRCHRFGAGLQPA